MANESVDQLRQEVMALKKDMALVKQILSEDNELSDEARAALRAARDTPESEYVELE